MVGVCLNDKNEWILARGNLSGVLTDYPKGLGTFYNAGVRNGNGKGSGNGNGGNGGRSESVMFSQRL